MDLNFRPVEAEDMSRLRPFYGLRPNRTCDSVFLDSFLWKDYYKVECAVSEDKAVLWLMEKDGILYLNLDPEKFEVTELDDLKDYLYDGNVMRTLAGKKLHKKKNRLNGFLKTYEGRYEYRRICCSDRQEVWQFMEKWRQQKVESYENEISLDYEVAGIHDILKNCSAFNVPMAGVYIDGELKAFTVGSLNERENMAVIHIEKADPEINGLYQFINQQFLVHEFPDVALVNREDDVGMPGLRKAKMSYYPVDFARKYSVKKKY